MELLREEEILNCIEDYINNETYSNAILLDGEWGSGKTFFTKEKIIPMIKEKTNKKVIYISTYGLKEESDLNKKIYFEILNENIPSNEKIDIIKKGGQIILSGAKVVKDILSLPNISSENIATFINLFQNIENYVMFFDDIERCQMPINEILGCINEFVEHKKVKVVIIANEKEIIKNNLLNNIEDKYKVALSKEINFEEVDKNAISNIEKYFYDKIPKDENTKLTKKEIENRVDYLFGEDKKYKQIREKLIGNTICYNPNIEEISMILLKSYIKDEDILGRLLSKTKLISNIMKEYNHINIRTLKVTLEKYKQILQNIDIEKWKKEDKFIDTMTIIFEYTLYVTIKYKKGENINDNKIMGLYADIVDENYKNITAFKFVNNLVLYSIINKDNIEATIEKYIKHSNFKLDNNDPLKKIESYWELEDDEIYDNINGIEKEIVKKAYSYDVYPKIIMIAVKLKLIGFESVDINHIFELMKNNIESDNRLIGFEGVDVFASNQEEIDLYNKYMDKLNELVNHANSITKKDSINNVINGMDGWGKNFYDVCCSHKNEYMASKEFFALIDIENLLKCIENSKVNDLTNFRRGMHYIYSFRNLDDYFKKDADSLIEFITKLKEKITNQSISRKYSQTLIIENIEEFLKDIEG